MEWPDWWFWELELSSHVERRMEDRDFTEVELREMLETADTFRPDFLEGRWVVESWRSKQRWEIIVEPDPEEMYLVVVTAYPIED